MKEKENLRHFDTSGYPVDRRNLHSMAKAKVVGKFKDTCDGRAAREFVGLRAKMYSLYISRHDKKPKMTAKGVKRGFVKKHIRHHMYVRTLKTRKLEHAKYRSFRSVRHNIYTIEQRKVSLSAFDDKRFILSDGVSTLAYGHCDIGKAGFK